MIQYLTHHQVNKQLWDACIAKACNKKIYAYAWYLDIVSPSWDCLVLDNYDAVMPLTHRKKYSIKYLYPPLFAQQLGVFSNIALRQSALLQFLNNIPSHFKYIDVNLNSGNTKNTLPNGCSFNSNYELNLSSNYQMLYSKYKGNTKRNINYATKHGLTISDTVSFSEIIKLFRNDKGRILKKIKDNDYNTLMQLLILLENKNLTKKFGVYDSSNILVTAAVFIVTTDEITFIFSGNSLKGKETSAMYFLIDHVVKQFCNHPLILDFEGGNSPGMAYFYSGFGSDNIPYPNYYQNRLPLLLKWLKK